MTLIVGIKCQDGAVMAADSAATLATADGVFTVRQSVSKLHLVGTSGVVGTSGFMGLGDRIKAKIEELWVGRKFSGMKTQAGMTFLREQLWKDILETEARAAVTLVGEKAGGGDGGQALKMLMGNALVALPFSSSLCLVNLSLPQATPEEVNDNLPLVAIGSGQQIADTFMTFLRKIFWDGRVPTLEQGLFTAIWTLDHAVEASPGMVAGPVRVAVMENRSRQWTARLLDETELGTYRETIESAKSALAGWKDFVAGPGPTSTIPAPPA